MLRLDGARLRIEREHNERAWLAWHVAALSRVPRMPPLRKLQVQSRRKRAQHWTEQLAQVKAWAAAADIKVIRKPADK